MSNSSWPRQVDADFIASIQARQRKETTITEAQRYRDTVLTETGGAVSEELVEVVLGKKSVTKEEEELLWSQLAGAAQERIAQAKAYRREVVESAKANAAYLQAILPEYRQRPELVLQNIYADAMEAILGAVDEKIVIDNPTDKQIRVQINRDPAIKPKQQETAENK
jgi:regulator of protease activity HflC (stomatin/prohibitin superfamily)